MMNSNIILFFLTKGKIILKNTKNERFIIILKNIFPLTRNTWSKKGTLQNYSAPFFINLLVAINHYC